MPPMLALPPIRADALPLAATAAYAVVQLALLAYAAHRWVVLGRAARARPSARRRPDPTRLPVVTVQLPVYNERRVVERLIDAVAALEWPTDRLEIQVLDDSTDETRERARAAVGRHRARGVDIRHLTRERRDGYKAGALAAGLADARGEWIAVFDADFVPAPDFLRRVAAHFEDPRTGMVQARWTHLNRDDGLLTAAQAVLLDAHFALEHASRAGSGLFFNFNGSAGVWRRACIEDAGGWSSATLTEDLELSYRAQLRGWRFVYEPEVTVAAELPAEMGALRSQQHRWAKGAVQTARRLLPRLLASPLPAAVKVEAVAHLTGNLCYPLLLALSLLLLPVLLATPAIPPALAWGLEAGTVALGLLPVVLFLAAGQRGGRRGSALVRDVAAALLLGMGLAVHNSRAVLEGLVGPVGEWTRTPKSGRGAGRAALPAYRAGGRAGAAELGMGAYALALGAIAVTRGRWEALPFVALLAVAFVAVGSASLRPGREASPGA